MIGLLLTTRLPRSGFLKEHFVTEGYAATLFLCAGSATPQGGPLAPFCVALWVSSGVGTAERQVAENCDALALPGR